MPRDLSRFFRPRHIAVVGGGLWCQEIIRQCDLMGYDGDIWPVHPKAESVAGRPAFASIDALPNAPDVAFIGVNRIATIGIVEQLSQRSAGGAVCFASGFSEAAAEDESGGDLQAQLVAAAGDMPILGPNCYGFINAMDKALLWPDQHGCAPVDTGVAILTQSSNIAINLTMQTRSLPIAYMVTCGNMAQTSQAEIAAALLDDPRVTAVGLHIEGFHNLRDWEALAQKAQAKGVPLIALKVGASEQAQQATVSHTASLAGSDAGAQAFLDRLGIPRLRALPDFLETLKLLHVHGRPTSNGIAAISCSGGEASLIADMAVDTGLTFPKLSDDQAIGLRDALGPMVALNNPLDYHTYVWRDTAAMTRAWSNMTGDGIGMTLSIIDYPRTDATDWACATQAALNVRAETDAPFGVVATLPELLPANVSEQLMAGGVVPFAGMREALSALDACRDFKEPTEEAVWLPGPDRPSTTMDEAAAKSALSGFGLNVPKGVENADTATLTEDITGLTGPFAVKGVGLAHKSEHGAVRLGIAAKDVPAVAAEIGTARVLIEEMTTDAIAELLVGVVRDPAHGFVLTLGAGGVLTEILRDTASLLLPTTPADIRAALDTLKIAPILHGYRGKPGVAIDAVIDAVLNIQDYIGAHRDTLDEVEVNPLLCTPTRAVAVDALIRKA